MTERPDFNLKCVREGGVWECPFGEKAQQRRCTSALPNFTFTCLEWTREPEDVVFFGDFAVYHFGTERGKHVIQIDFEKRNIHLTEKLSVDKLFNDLKKVVLAPLFHEKFREVYGNDYRNRLSALILKLQEKFPARIRREVQPIEIPEARIKLNHETEVFVSEASDGYFEQRTGFYIKRGDNWIVTELTFLRGTAYEKDKDGNVVETRQAVRPVLFYNRNNERGYFDPREKVMEFDGKTIFLEGETDIGTTLHSLMSYETAEKFLAGETVRIRDVYSELAARIKKFVNCEWDERLYDLFACIAIGTHFFDIFGAFPIIFIYGPFGTGKGRVLMCITYAGHRGIMVVDPTSPTFYRMIDALRPTLGFDELTMAWEGFQAHWRSSFKKGAKVPRMEKVKDERMALRFFEQFGPTLATSTVPITGKEKEATESRFVVAVMKKANDPNPEERDPQEYEFDDIRNKLYLCRLTQANYIDLLSQGIKGSTWGFSGREWELWRPILTIALAVGGEVIENIVSLAKEQVTERRRERYEKEKAVLKAIEKMFREPITNEALLSFTPKELSNKLYQLLKEEFGYEENDDERIARQIEIETKNKFNKVYSYYHVGHILHRLNLKPKVSSKGSKQYTIKYSELLDLKARYGD